MKKLTLDFNEPKLYEAIALSCQSPDYKLVFHINRTLKTDFKRVDDFPFSTGKKEKKFSLYRHNDSANGRTLFLLNNKSNGAFLFNNLKQFDYLLLVDTEIYDSHWLETFRKKIKTVKGILFAQIIDLEKEKNYDLFAEEFELHDSL